MRLICWSFVSNGGCQGLLGACCRMVEEVSAPFWAHNTRLMWACEEFERFWGLGVGFLQESLCYCTKWRWRRRETNESDDVSNQVRASNGRWWPWKQAREQESKNHHHLCWHVWCLRFAMRPCELSIGRDGGTGDASGAVYRRAATSHHLPSSYTSPARVREICSSQTPRSAQNRVLQPQIATFLATPLTIGKSFLQ